MKALKQFFWFLMLLAMFAAAAAGGYAVYLEREDRAEIDKLRAQVAGFDPRFDKFKGAVGDLSKGFTSLVLEEADLDARRLAADRQGLLPGRRRHAPQDKGVRVRGKIINSTAVLHEGLTFMFRIGKSLVDHQPSARGAGGGAAVRGRVARRGARRRQEGVHRARELDDLVRGDDDRQIDGARRVRPQQDPARRELMSARKDRAEPSPLLAAAEAFDAELERFAHLTEAAGHGTSARRRRWSARPRR